jgi:hypothetical protein
LFKNILSILVFMSLSNSSVLFTLEPLVAVTEELRIKPESESELDSVSFGVLIISKLELKLIEISIRVLRIVLVFSLIYR